MAQKWQANTQLWHGRMIIQIVVLCITLILTCVNAHSFDYKDFSISKKDIGESYIYTADLRITDKIVEEGDFIVDFEYSHIRHDGLIMQVYYSNAMGKAQWSQFPFPNGIYIMPSSLLLPIGEWIEHGMKSDGSWWVRIVMLVPKNE